MIRFIVRREVYDAISGQRDSGFETVLLDVPELEVILGRGGFGPSGYDQTSFVGVELVRAITSSNGQDAKPESKPHDQTAVAVRMTEERG